METESRWIPAMIGTLILGGLLVLTSACGPDDEPALVNGFDLTGAAVPPSTILVGTRRDGIKALDAPTFVSAEEADLRGSARVLGLVHGGVAKAYGIDVLTYHEIVNDRFDGRPVAVTYCPLCASGLAFVAEYDGRRLVFGVSGLLHNSDLLMFDRGTESLWSQLQAQAVTGPLNGATLTRLPLVETSWADWRTRHPETILLSAPTNTGLAYSRPLYPGYAESEALWYPVSHDDASRPPKSKVLGLVIGSVAKAWPLDELEREAASLDVERLALPDDLGGRSVVIIYDVEAHSAEVTTADGERLPGVTAYWFAWHAFHPGAGVWTASAGRGSALDSGQARGVAVPR